MDKKNITKFILIFIGLILISYIIGAFTTNYGDWSVGFPLDFKTGGDTGDTPRVYYPLNLIVDILFYAGITVLIIKYGKYKKGKNSE